MQTPDDIDDVSPSQSPVASSSNTPQQSPQKYVWSPSTPQSSGPQYNGHRRGVVFQAGAGVGDALTDDEELQRAINASLVEQSNTTDDLANLDTPSTPSTGDSTPNSHQSLPPYAYAGNHEHDNDFHCPPLYQVHNGTYSVARYPAAPEKPPVSPSTLRLLQRAKEAIGAERSDGRIKTAEQTSLDLDIMLDRYRQTLLQQEQEAQALEEARKALPLSDFIAQLKVGDRLDGLDRFNTWYEAEVLEDGGDQLFLRFVNPKHGGFWAEKYNEWIPKEALERLAPLHTHSVDPLDTIKL
eukprot:GILK01006798.1.p1 GENE.GILK01006798.1~~GILK01006798.1.p1  ORF type:complete len:297 (-),score=56.20 GILK01006798.1:193-1083(-)